MLPAARVRRASFLPREVRTSAVTVISFLTLQSPHCASHSRLGCFGFEVRAARHYRPCFFVGSRARLHKTYAQNYTNSVLTEVSSCMDRMALAINCAMDSALIRRHCLAASESGIEFVTTTSRNSDSSIRLTAGPESTACVAQAETLLAPFSSRA